MYTQTFLRIVIILVGASKMNLHVSMLYCFQTGYCETYFDICLQSISGVLEHLKHEQNA